MSEILSSFEMTVWLWGGIDENEAFQQALATKSDIARTVPPDS